MATLSLAYFLFILLSVLYYSPVDGQHYKRLMQNALSLLETFRDKADGSHFIPSSIDFLNPHQGLKSSESFDVFPEESKLQPHLNNVEVLETLVREYHADGLVSRLEESQYNVSTICLNHTMEYFEHLLQGQLWALKMFDAMGKVPSGLLSGHFFWSGDYDQCLGIEAVLSNTTSPQPAYEGKYCSLVSSFPLTPGPNGTNIPASIGALSGIALQIGLCLPSSCSDADAKALVKTGISLLPVDLSTFPITVACTVDRDISQDTRAITSICVSAVIVAILLVGTAYDILVVKDCDLSAASERKREAVKFQDPKVGIAGKLLLSFSLYTNATKLLSTKQGEGSLRCLNGIRFLSMRLESLITYSFELIGRFTAQPIANGTYSVDSFFLLSGLLVTYLTMREMAKREGKLNWFLYYFHRYWRLTPPLMLIMWVYVPLFKYLGSGPFWPRDGTEINYCQSTWWTNMLYVNNLVNAEQQCMGWTWYLANDMQFYVVSPLILLPLYYSGLIGVIIITVFLLATLIASGVISSTNHYLSGALSMADQKAFLDLYIRPWTRMGPYLVGMTLGYILYRTKCKVSLPRSYVLVIWLAATACGISVIYGMKGVNSNDVQLTNDVNALYNAISRTAWALALAWVVFACCTGHGGVVNRILSWDIFVPLSRLTYCAYLVHPIVMFWFYYGQKHAIILSDEILVYYFLGNMLIAYSVAFVVSLAFEAPMMGLEKVLLHRDRRN
ncbi:nose resistant to fluoxetine protein 6-like [Liolophura sinensis]|uniref:nose resistant to fluoxetine protein 6-like n=1 Tax=Liolophura sinensis TaxID=3198878 RepID=UPI0031589D84